MIDDQYKMGLMAAEGYLELGMTDDAMRELPIHERLVILRPDAWALRRDRGLCAARLGDKRTAARDLEGYLQHVQDAPDRAQVSAALSQLI